MFPDRLKNLVQAQDGNINSYYLCYILSCMLWFCHIHVLGILATCILQDIELI